ncbi:MAG: hypothetical protein M0R28_08900 [Pigmentiphaga sp.]|nr:hypothetical protein [Pigmentiphaga sp.]
MSHRPHADDPLPVSIPRTAARHWPLRSPMASPYVLREPEPDENTLETLAPTNPFAVIVIAYLEYRATRPDTRRMASKLRLAQALAKWGYDKEQREAVFLIIDSLLLLPEALEERFTDILTQAEAPIVQQLTSVQRVIPKREKAACLEEGERLGIIKGKLEGAAFLLQTPLQQRFAPLPHWALARIAQVDTETLQRWALNVLQAEQIEDVFGH